MISLPVKLECTSGRKVEAQAPYTLQVISARDPVPMLPLCTFSLKPEHRLNGYDEFDVADRLRQRGWVVPAYTMAPDAQVKHHTPF